jgi:hypothetical protein
MDMRKYTSGFIRPEDLHDGPRQERIINVYISEKHDCPVLEFESGDQLIVFSNSSNVRALARAYGFDSNDWLGHVVELSFGTYTNKDGEAKETVTLKPISLREGVASNVGETPKCVIPPAPSAKRTLGDDMDDEIPFNAGDEG